MSANKVKPPKATLGQLVTEAHKAGVKFSISLEDKSVHHPAHYTSHPSGVECIQVTQHMNFCRGNAMKYIWRAGDKGNEVQDLQKAIWYLECEIKRIQTETTKQAAKDLAMAS